MAVQRFRLDLSQASFPLLSGKIARSVIIPSLDPQGRQRADGADVSNSPYTKVQVTYMENVMPVREGYRSTKNVKVVNAADPYTNIDSIHLLVDNQSATVLFSPALGENWLYPVGGPWISNPFGAGGPFGLPAPEATSPNSAATATITTAVVEGYSFVCYSRLTSGLARSYTFTGTYDPAATALTVQALAGAYNVTFTLGSSPELTVSGRVWTLAIPSLALPVGSMSLISTMTIGGSPVGDVQTVAVGTDMSLLSLSPLVTNTLQLANGNSVTNLPFDPGTIDGVAASNGYLLLWSGLTIAWAPFNTDTNSFDWTLYRNGAFTGAGYQIPEAIAGNITAVASTAGGFIMFTATNAVAATYHANNINAPWVFREIPGAGGVKTYEHLTVDSSLGSVYAYTSAGMQKISLNSATGIFPDIDDFIKSGTYEVYVGDTSPLQEIFTPLPLRVRLTCVNNRYLCLSYGEDFGPDSNYEFILIYDLTLERWGKIKTPSVHRDCFSFESSTASDLYSDIGMVSADGSIYQCDMSLYSGAAKGVLILGRLQLARSRNTQINSVELADITSSNTQVYIQPSYTGAVYSAPIAMYPAAGFSAKRTSLVDCNTANIIIVGGFNLTTVLIEAAPTGVM